MSPEMVIEPHSPQWWWQLSRKMPCAGLGPRRFECTSAVRLAPHSLIVGYSLGSLVAIPRSQHICHELHGRIAVNRPQWVVRVVVGGGGGGTISSVQQRGMGGAVQQRRR